MYFNEITFNYHKIIYIIAVNKCVGSNAEYNSIH